MAAGSNPLSHVVQHPLKTVPAEVGPLTPNGEITVLSDQITMMILAAVLLVLLLPPLFKRRSKGEDDVESMVPTGAANGIEAICSYLRTEMARPALGENTDRFIKYIWTAFFFVLTMNLLGLLPIPAVSALFGTHLGGTATANIWVTGTMALTTLFMMVFNGIRIAGMKHFLAHLCPGPLWLAPILVPVELVGFLAKTFALAVRLFANMVAGHTLLAVLLGFIATAGAAGAGMGLAIAVPVVLGSVAINMLEIFVAFLQAFIFTFLTTLFIGMMVTVHHDDHHEEAHA